MKLPDTQLVLLSAASQRDETGLRSHIEPVSGKSAAKRRRKGTGTEAVYR